MKFLDFLQDVTAVGVVLALSAFLIEPTGEIGGDLASASSASASDVSSIEPSTDLLDELDQLIDSVVAPPDATPSGDGIADARMRTPAPLDLDTIEQSLDEQGRSGFVDSHVPRRASEFLPEGFQPVELPDDLIGTRALPSDSIAPATPSRPMGTVNRGFDDSDLFDDILSTGREFSASPPPPTRRLGPVEMLSPPSF